MNNSLTWFRKRCHNKQETINVRYLLKSKIKGIPQIGAIGTSWYDVEMCAPYKKKDVTIEGLCAILSVLNQNWYAVKSEIFTAGIYKFIKPYPLLTTAPQGKTYYRHINQQLHSFIEDIDRRAPTLLPKWISRWVGNISSCLSKLSMPAVPPCFVLLHGDLRFENIVCKEDAPLLIDYEHMRFGLRELDAANLIFDYIKVRSDSPTYAQDILCSVRRTIATRMKWGPAENARFLLFFSLISGLEYVSCCVSGDKRKAGIAKTLAQGFFD